MTLGEKVKSIRKNFGLTQEQLASIMNVSRQVVTKWECDNGIPDISNLQELSKVFGITVDYLLDNDNNLPALSMKINIDKDKYKNKLSAHKDILKYYYPNPWEIYILSQSKKLNFIESILNLFTGGDYFLIKEVSDLSSYYLVKKDELKLLVIINGWLLEVIELPSNTKARRFSYSKNSFINCGKLK